MELEEFRRQFMEELRQNAQAENTGLKEQFINKTLDELETIGDLNGPIPMPINMRGPNNRIMAFDAYAYDEADSSLVMIAFEFNENDNETVSLTNSRIDEICRHITSFLDESVNGSIRKYVKEYTSPAAVHIAKEFNDKIGTGAGMYSSEVLRFKLYIITNSVLSKSVKDITQEDFLGRPVTLNIWTLERFFQSYVSDSSEILEFDTQDFGCEGIQYLKANLGENKKYDAYMAIVPGRFLANLYLKYGSKLLQGNVRAFLSVRGKVNKGIRNTIINSPSNFFTYNNGIAVVSRSIGFSKTRDKITHFKDFQIINGGQTTASLANVIIRKEDKNGMDTLYVPMKLTVMNVDDDMSEEQVQEYNSITKDISKCANSQNTVSDADFFSNHPFHTMIEALSGKVMAPPAEGKPYPTTWFYERSRGKWEQEQMKLTPAQRKEFCLIHPKKQVIKKERLARCLNAVNMHPHLVCMGLSKSLKQFALYIEDLYENSRDSINEEFFKKCVCSIIIFDSLDKMIANSEWYPKGGNKPQIAAYTISKLMSLIPKGKDIDWRSIWQKQSLYTELSFQLIDLAYQTHLFLLKTANGGVVRGFTVKESTWEAFKDYKYQLSDTFLESLISIEETKEAEKAAKRAHRFDAKIDASVEIFKLGGRYWMNVYNALRFEKILSYGELDIIKGIALCINGNRLPSSAQCSRLIKIVTKAEDGGYIMP